MKPALSSEDIGFTIGPRLNAAGRLGQAALAVELLTTAEPDRACWEVEPLGAADAGTDPDGGVGDAGPNDGATADGDDGCGCRAHESGTDVPWWSLLLMVLRRRRAAS